MRYILNFNKLWRFFEFYVKYSYYKNIKKMDNIYHSVFIIDFYILTILLEILYLFVLSNT